ncbi:MAG: hypothetical protein ACJASX_002475 [Limisphaerales bacterium]|jgi:hypothetical protein
MRKSPATDDSLKWRSPGYMAELKARSEEWEAARAAKSGRGQPRSRAPPQYSSRFPMVFIPLSHRYGERLTLDQHLSVELSDDTIQFRLCST